jgi:multimeric flavodoxin WrbA
MEMLSIYRRIFGEVKVVDAYFSNVKPCIDCRYCHSNAGCTQKDDMVDVYNYIEECDNIIIASPLYFSELSGQLLALMSRLQMYWCARFFRKVEPIAKKKNGGIFIVGGGDGSIEKAIETAECLLHKMNAKSIGVVYSYNTDKIAAKDDTYALENVKELAVKLNKAHENK